MQPLPSTTRSLRTIPLPKPGDASVRDSIRILEAVVRELSERVEILEARELLARPR